MNKIAPIQKIDLSGAEPGKTYQVHVDRLASFKSTVSRYNKNSKQYNPAFVPIKFDYSPAVNNYTTATCKS